MLKLTRKTNQAGVTLLETILVLSLIAIIMIGGLNLYRNATNSSKANEARRQVAALATGIRSLYQSSSSYENIDIQNLIEAGAVPADLISGTDELTNTFGELVVVSEVNGIGRANSHFEIEYPGMPRESCYQIVTSDLGATIVGHSSGCTSAVKGATDCVLGAVEPEDAPTFCPDPNENTLYFTYN